MHGQAQRGEEGEGGVRREVWGREGGEREGSTVVHGQAQRGEEGEERGCGG